MGKTFGYLLILGQACQSLTNSSCEVCLTESYPNCRGALSDPTTVSGETLPVLGMLKDSLHVAGGIYPCELQVVKNLTYEAVMS